MDIPLDGATTKPDEEIQGDKPHNGNYSVINCRR
jgi:hypothetical protein